MTIVIKCNIAAATFQFRQLTTVSLIELAPHLPHRQECHPRSGLTSYHQFIIGIPGKKTAKHTQSVSLVPGLTPTINIGVLFSIDDEQLLA